MATRRQCQRALEDFQNEVSKLKSVVGLGIVKLDESERDSNAVAVYVNEILDKKTLPKEEQIPNYLTIKGRGKSKIQIPIQIIEQGGVELEGGEGLLGKEPL